MCRFSALLLTVMALAQYPVRCLGQPRKLHASKILIDARDVDKEYDYIVVGGGTSGLTVADRLTENGAISVLVVEYGQLSLAALVFCPALPFAKSLNR